MVWLGHVRSGGLQVITEVSPSLKNRKVVNSTVQANYILIYSHLKREESDNNGKFCSYFNDLRSHFWCR